MIEVIKKRGRFRNQHDHATGHDSSSQTPITLIVQIIFWHNSFNNQSKINYYAVGFFL